MFTRVMGLVSLSVLFVASQGFAQAPKIAIVNVSKVFDALDEAQLANQTLRTRSEGYRTKAQLMALTETELVRAFNNGKQQLQKGELADDQRENLVKALNIKAQQIKDHRDSRQAHIQAANKDISNYSNRVRSTLLAKIQTAINEVAKAKKLDYVFDLSGVTSTNVPSVVYTSNKTDLTDEVIKKLNDNLKKGAMDVKPETPAPAPK